MLSFRKEDKDTREKGQRAESAGSSNSGPSHVPGSGASASLSTTPAKRLGEILVEEGLIGLPQLEEALAVQKEQGGFIGQVLVRLGYVKQDAIISCLVKQCKIPHLSLVDYEISKEVLQIMPKDFCLAHNLLPIDRLGRILTVAMVNPFDLEALEQARKVCPDLRIKPILCDWEHFKIVSARVFGKSAAQKTDEYDASELPLGPKRMKPSSGKSPQPTATPSDGARPNSEGVQAALNAAVTEVIQEVAADSVPAKPEKSSSDLSTLVRESIGGAIQQAMATLMVDSRPSVTERGRVAPSSLSAQELTDVVREGISGAMQEALATIAVQLQARPGRGKAAAGPSSQELAEVLRQSIGSALEETLGPMLAQLRAVTQEGKSAVPGELTEAIREGIRSAMQEAPSPVATESRRSSADELPQGQELVEVLRATVREALRENEATAVVRANLHDLEMRNAEKIKRLKHASVSTFRGPRRKGSATPDTPEMKLDSDERVLAAMTSERLLEEFTFASFCVGKNNAVTYKLCEAVAAQPGSTYNPFFLYGDVGLGKTHLINATGNAILGRDPDQRIGYVSSSRFVTRLADALRDDAADAFRANYCHWDVLILDDIQFLGGRVEAQEEFFHIFNVLQHEGRQIIIAGDKPPDRLGLLEQRLVSRFAGGIVVNVKPPEWETRMAILQHHLSQAKIAIDDEIVSLIAMRVPNDVRKMIGALRKVLAYAELAGETISCELAHDILGHLGIEEAA